MALVHITEAEAAQDFAGVLAKARAGEDVRIAAGTDVFSLARVQTPRTLSEALRKARARNSSLTLDPGFGADVETVTRQHDHETLIDPWEVS